MSKRWLTGVLFVLALAACTPSEFSEPPDVTLIDLKPLDVSLFEQRMVVTLRIRNPNDTAMALDGMRFSLEVNGLSFAKGSSDRSVTVPRLNEATIEAIADIATTDLLRQAVAAPDAKGVAYRVKGVLFLAGLGHRSVPFDQQGDFNGLTGEK